MSRQIHKLSPLHLLLGGMILFLMNLSLDDGMTWIHGSSQNGVTILVSAFPIHTPPPRSKHFSIQTHNTHDISSVFISTTTQRKNHNPNRNRRRPVVPPLHQSNSNSNNQPTKKFKSKGVYARPSAAIERGSGFFVPGLEGSRVRILFGALVLLLNFVNSHSSNSLGMEDNALLLSQRIAVVYGILLLLQGGIEVGKEMGLGVSLVPTTATATRGAGETESLAGGPTRSAQDETMEQTISSRLKESTHQALAEAVTWVAASYISLTPATHVLFLEVDEDREAHVLYSLGRGLIDGSHMDTDADLDTDANTIQQDGRRRRMEDGIKAAMETVHQSKGGRVSIPSTHPAALALLPEGGRRCVLLQRVTVSSVGEDDDEEEEEEEEKGGGERSSRLHPRQLCLVVGSDQLLPSFTKNDLKWLGQLGEYLVLHS